MNNNIFVHIICKSLLLVSIVLPARSAAPDAPDLADLPIPNLRRLASMDDSIANYHLEQGTLEEKLITMVSYYPDSAKALGLTKQKIVQFINSAQMTNFNPYSDMHNAYVITLACRYGMLEVVQSIANKAPSSLQCLSWGYTPLDEAVIFEKRRVAKYLHGVGASLKSATVDQLNALLKRPSHKKRKSANY